MTSDLSNMVGYSNAFNVPTMTLYEKFTYFLPGNLYYSFD
jgi:hypothetical protein